MWMERMCWGSMWAFWFDSAVLWNSGLRVCFDVMWCDGETGDLSLGRTPFGKRSYILRDLSIALSIASSSHSLGGNWPKGVKFHTGNHTVAHIINKQVAKLPFPFSQMDRYYIILSLSVCFSKFGTHVPVGSEQLCTDSCAARLKILETR